MRLKNGVFNVTIIQYSQNGKGLLKECGERLKNIHRGVLIAITLLIGIFNIPNAISFAAGSLIVMAVGIVRAQFYKVMLSGTKFSTGSYIGYIFFLFFVLWVPLGVAFFFPNIIGPWGYAGAILFDRLWQYVYGLFSEKRGVE